jgi:hypothetical protein
LNQAAARQELGRGSRQGCGGCTKVSAVIGVGLWRLALGHGDWQRNGLN